MGWKQHDRIDDRVVVGRRVRFTAHIVPQVDPKLEVGKVVEIGDDTGHRACLKILSLLWGREVVTVEAVVVAPADA